MWERESIRQSYGPAPTNEYRSIGAPQVFDSSRLESGTDQLKRQSKTNREERVSVEVNGRFKVEIEEQGEVGAGVDFKGRGPAGARLVTHLATGEGQYSVVVREVRR